MTARYKHFLIGCVLLVVLIIGGCIVGVVITAITTDTEELGVSEPGFTPTPGLAWYWDRGACFDLFDRIVIALEAGISNDEIMDSLDRADGAVKRYGGALKVINHCEQYREEYD